MDWRVFGVFFLSYDGFFKSLLLVAVPRVEFWIL